LNGRIGPQVWEKNDLFYPYRRAKHVYDEANRVEEFIRVCEDPILEVDARLHKMGNLLDEAQASLHEMYECGCPEITMITEFARKNGAYGSRLTGAGWGGCTVSMVENGKVSDFINAFNSFFPDRVNSENFSFVVVPESGVTLFDNTGIEIDLVEC